MLICGCRFGSDTPKLAERHCSVGYTSFVMLNASRVLCPCEVGKYQDLQRQTAPIAASTPTSCLSEARIPSRVGSLRCNTIHRGGVMSTDQILLLLIAIFTGITALRSFIRLP